MNKAPNPNPSLGPVGVKRDDGDPSDCEFYGDYDLGYDDFTDTEGACERHMPGNPKIPIAAIS